MELILLEDIDKLGYKYDVVTVKNGYGRNYLIPQGLAMIANSDNRRKLNDIIDKQAAEEAELKGHYQEIADKLKDVTLKIGAKSGTSGKIFGSVTNIQIAAALKDQFGVEVERRKIQLPEEVKSIGNYEVLLKLHPEVESKVAFEVISE